MKEKKIPMRRCVGCMQSKPKKELIRICGSEDGTVRFDPTGKAPGRGVYVCRSADCFQQARKRKAIGRGLKIEVSQDQLERLAQELTKYEKQNP